MTFAEIILLGLFLAAIYRLLRPVQRRLEGWIYRKASSPLDHQSSTVTSIKRLPKDN
ncbi:MAG TPA: hypothetical protein VF400_16145 [Anaeromyxobacteraceae bacterium]